MVYHTDRRSLEREVKVETYRTGGPGGQHRNVTDSAVRLTHLPSMVVVTSADSRSQHQNKEKAFDRLRRRLQALNRVPPPRIPTRRSRAAKERTLSEKKRRQRVKAARRPVSGDSC
jgi:protein subunit release factor A